MINDHLLFFVANFILIDAFYFKYDCVFKYFLKKIYFLC